MNSFIRFLVEFMVWKFAFETNWPLDAFYLPYDKKLKMSPENSNIKSIPKLNFKVPVTPLYYIHCYMAQQLHSCHNSLKLENLRLPFTRFWQKESSSCFMASMRKGLKTWLFSDILAFHKYWQANSWQSSK